MVNEYYAKHGGVPDYKPKSVPSNNLFLCLTVTGSGQSCFDTNDLSSDHEQYLTPETVAEMTSGQCNHAACVLTATTHYWIHSLITEISGGKLLQIWMISYPTWWRSAGHFGSSISPTGGANKRKYTQSVCISATWHAIYPQYQLSAVKNHSQEPSQTSHTNTVCKSQ